MRYRYLLKRLGLSILSIWVVATLLFGMFRLLPGDPATALADPRMSESVREMILEQYGLSEPLHIQYTRYIENLATGNLGISFSENQPVSGILLERAANTLILMLTAVVISFVIGPIIGAYLAWRRNTRAERYGVGMVLLAYAAPVFWTGMIAISIFSFNLGWLPGGGMYTPGSNPQGIVESYLSVDFFRHLLLPLTVTTLYYLTLPTLTMRNNMISVLNKDFIELKRAEGLSEMRILYGHVARNAVLPVFHYAAVAIGFAFGGSVIIETVFSWPGLGQVMWEAVRAQDYPLAQGSFLVIAIIIITLNLIVDVLSTYLDPQATAAGSKK